MWTARRMFANCQDQFAILYQKSDRKREQRLRLSSFTRGVPHLCKYSNTSMAAWTDSSSIGTTSISLAGLSWIFGQVWRRKCHRSPSVTLHKCTDQSGITDLVHLQLTVLHLLKVPEKGVESTGRAIFKRSIHFNQILALPVCGKIIFTTRRTQRLI